MSFVSSFDRDPFFSELNLPQALALEHRSRSNHGDRQVSRRHHDDRQDLQAFANPFTFMQNIMNNMGQMMSQMETMDSHGPMTNGVSFSSSTITSMNRGDGGQPRIIQATSEKLRGPEGLERTRKAVRDTGRDIEKMEIAHRLGERGHRIVKERDRTSGQLVENREFEHIDNENEFEREWFSRAERLGLKNPHGNRFDTQANNVLATPTSYGRLRSQSQDPRQYAIEDAPSHHSSSSRRERRRK